MRGCCCFPGGPPPVLADSISCSSTKVPFGCSAALSSGKGSFR